MSSNEKNGKVKYEERGMVTTPIVTRNKASQVVIEDKTIVRRIYVSRGSLTDNEITRSGKGVIINENPHIKLYESHSSLILLENQPVIPVSPSKSILKVKEQPAPPRKKGKSLEIKLEVNKKAFKSEPPPTPPPRKKKKINDLKNNEHVETESEVRPNDVEVLLGSSLNINSGEAVRSLLDSLTRMVIGDPIDKKEG